MLIAYIAVNMAVVCLSLSGTKFTFIVFLLILFDNRHYKEPMKRCIPELAVGMKISAPDIPLLKTNRLTITTKQNQPISRTSMLFCLRVIKLTQKILLINVMLICGDVSINPGPVVNCNACSFCRKMIKL